MNIHLSSIFEHPYTLNSRKYPLLAPFQLEDRDAVVRSIMQISTERGTLRAEQWNEENSTCPFSLTRRVTKMANA